MRVHLASVGRRQPFSDERVQQGRFARFTRPAIATERLLKASLDGLDLGGASASATVEAI